MTEIKTVARLKIHKGKLDKFKILAKECMKIVREKDQGTLQYDWFLNENETECVMLERYLNSKALLNHMSNLGDIPSQLFSVGEFSTEIFGKPSDELMKACQGLDVVVYSEFQ